jgi:hypothetical protein
MFDYKQLLLLGVKKLSVDTSIFGWPNNCKGGRLYWNMGLISVKSI